MRRRRSRDGFLRAGAELVVPVREVRPGEFLVLAPPLELAPCPRCSAAKPRAG